MEEGNEESLGLKEGASPMVSTIIEDLEHRDWYKEIVYYLKNLTCPNHLPNHKKITLKLKVSRYRFLDIVSRKLDQGIGWKNLDG